MALEYSFVIPPMGVAENHIVREMFEDIRLWAETAGGGANTSLSNLDSVAINTALRGIDGSTSSPAYSFSSDTDLGIYREGVDILGISAGGARRMFVGTTEGVGIQGTQSNDNAPAGYVGEYVASVVTTVVDAPATTVWGNLTSISLTAGDWDVSAGWWWDRTSSTWSRVQGSISTDVGTSPVVVIGDNYAAHAFANSSSTPTLFPITVANYRLSLSTTTTVYMKYAATYSAGTPRCGGRISARRVR